MTEEAQPGDEAPRTASEILSSAERLADEIRGRAHADAAVIRARAGSDSDVARAATAERVQRLSALADGMLERLHEVRAELDALGASLAGSGGVATEPDAAGAADPVGVPDAADPVGVPDAAAVPDAVGVPDAAAAPEPPAGGVDDAGARLIALNLALSDTPRDEAARQLRDQIPDAERLVDEVYASVDR